MELQNVTIKKSLTPKMVRLSGEVKYEDRRISPEIYWYEVNENLIESLSRSGNPWLACLLPLAAKLGEPLRLSLPVDSTLFYNAKKLMKIWKGWYPKLSEVKIEAELENSGQVSQSSKRKTVLFFSGGIDSFFSLLHCDLTSSFKIDDLLFILGIDIKTENIKAFNRLNAILLSAAHDLNHNLISLTTNLRETRLQEAKWGELYHGPALASIALALENCYERALISSTHDFKDMQPWGSTPLTDPLLSTSKTEIVHYGADFTRVQKTEEVAKSEVALRTLKVCSNSRSDFNCSNCPKCYRTMINLDLIGVLDSCSRFSKDQYQVEKISKVYLQDKNSRSFFAELEMLAISKKRDDIVKNIEKSFYNSKHLNRWLVFATFLRNLPLFWRGAHWIEKVVFHGYLV